MMLTGFSGNLCCSWGQPWALLSSSSHMGSLLRGLMAIFLLTSLLGSLFLPSSHQGDRENQEFLCRESPVWMWGGGCRPPGGGCLSFAFLDQIFLREDLLVWLRALLYVLGGLLWIFFASPFCALGLYKMLLVRYHSAFSAFIWREDQEFSVYPSSECTCASALPPHVLTPGYLQTLTLQVQEGTC